MALALVATGGHPQPSADDFCCTVGGYSSPLPNPEAASGPGPAADWQSVCGPKVNSSTAGMCRIIYLEAFSQLVASGRLSTKHSIGLRRRRMDGADPKDMRYFTQEEATAKVLQRVRNP